MTVSPPSSSKTAAPPVTRREGIWLAISLVAGAVLRLGNLSQVAVEHFDEAVYASNLLFPSEQGGEYPFRQLYAPPLLPAAIEWTTIFGQLVFGDVPTWWPMLPTLLCGLATIPSIWWIVRQWFSPRAGIVAALLIATHEFHAAYSRTALTDIPLTLFVLWAVHWFWIALQTGRNRDAVIAGIFTSLAWWTKYNGWLPLAIVAAGGTLWQIVTPAGERTWHRLIQVWLIGAATAFVLWLPVLWDCQQIGGYSVVAANHRRYVEGFTKWVANFWRGIENLDEFIGPTSAGGILLAFAGSYWLPKGTAEPQQNSESGRRLAECFCLAWFWGLFVATPLYVPYARLWEPWLVAGCLALAGSFPFWNVFSLRTRSAVMGSFFAVTGILFLLTLGVGFDYVQADVVDPPTCLESRSSALQVAKEIRAKVADPNVPVFVHSEPAVWFHLREQGQPAIIADGLKFLNQPLAQAVYLVVGPQAERDPAFERERQAFERRLEAAGEFSFSPSRIVLLDQISPRELAEHPEYREMTVRLYRIER